MHLTPGPLARLACDSLWLQHRHILDFFVVTRQSPSACVATRVRFNVVLQVAGGIASASKAVLCLFCFPSLYSPRHTLHPKEQACGPVT